MFNRWPKLTASLAILAVAAAVGHLVYRYYGQEAHPPGQIWFYNLATHELFAASDRKVPPIDTKSGPGTGVRAYVYVPENRPEPANRFIAFLETLTPELKQQIEADLKQPGPRLGIGFALDKKADGILVSSPDVIKWYPKFSAEGMEVMEAGKRKAAGERIKPCLP